MSDETLVLRGDADGVATLTLNRPDKRNALNVDMFVALDAHLAALEQQIDKVERSCFVPAGRSSPLVLTLASNSGRR